MLVLDDGDDQVFRESPAVAAFIYRSPDMPTEGVLAALRRGSSERQSFVYQVAEDFLVDSPAGPGRAAVTLICAPAASA